MTYRESCILLPCHSLEDFPMHYEGEDADGLLAAWTSLWHPALLAATGAMPRWQRGDNPPHDLEGKLIVVPGVSGQEIPTGFADRAAKEGALLIQGNLPREEIVAAALERLDESAAAISPDICADFMALGYCYLQVELLTRQMRYSTNLDEVHFQRQTVAGAQAALAGHDDEARSQLAACFDLLAQERDHYYAVDTYMVDLTLLAPHTLGSTLAAQLSWPVPQNLLLTGQLVTALHEHHPDSLAVLRQGLEAGYIGLVGGDPAEEPSPLLSCETLLKRLQQGIHQFEHLLGRRPHVYGRRSYGLTVLYPGMLQRLGYTGVIHAALGEGRYPEGTQLKIRWQGPDHTAIDAIGRLPLDAARPETFLALASKLGETMDMDHVATVSLAHWPGQVSPWYHDLRRIARYGGMLGKFVTLDEYFRETDYPGHTERFQADQYRSPILPEAVASGRPDPISRSIRYWRRCAIQGETLTLETLVSLVRNQPVEVANRPATYDEHGDEAFDPETTDDPLVEAREQAVRQAAGLVTHQQSNLRPGYLIINPTSIVRRVNLDLPELESLPAVEKPVYAVAAEGRHKYVVADVPPLGFAWITGGDAAGPAKRSSKLLAEPHRLFNEFFEVHISPTTGALQSIYEYEKRGNLLSQQLALRVPRKARGPAGASAVYSVMAADEVQVTATSSVMGEITVDGRLLSRRGDLLARYRQRYQLWRGSRVLRLAIDLEPVVEPEGDPWNSYYACRFAWADDGEPLWRGVNQLRERAEAKRLEAPNYVTIGEFDRTIAILTGGLPYHRRTDERMLDSLLIVRGERQRHFEIGIAVNPRNALHEAMALLTPALTVQQVAGAPVGPASAWLFHVDSRNILATSWTPLTEEGQVRGFRVRLLETAGRSARPRLRAFRAISSARKVDFQGQSLGPCRVENGAVTIDMNANEWAELEAHW